MDCSKGDHDLIPREGNISKKFGVCLAAGAPKVTEVRG